MRTSIFEIFKIGIGPSSSHTVGPMRAAGRWVNELQEAVVFDRLTRVCAELYGSLALTGIGHATDRAILLGLCGETPERTEPAAVGEIVERIRTRQLLPLAGRKEVEFIEARDLLFHRDQTLPGHPNGMRFRAFDSGERALHEAVYYSIGGGFIRKEGERTHSEAAPLPVPYPFSSGAELLVQANSHGLAIWQVVLSNELTLRPEAEVLSAIRRIWQVMSDCVDRGLQSEGILPGGLNVRRRARRVVARIQARAHADALDAMDWVNAFAMAVNEENAAGGRVVTAPTNGAAGLIPAVGRYYMQFIPGANEDGIIRYLLTAGAIGILYKENASISGAEVGCQGEVGVACSMAAAGLAADLEGSNEAIEHAAEIGM
ncbi:MAG: L-serine ammonia-lyase, partial [Acidobacteriaceae bacterium]|nr:L-serine ammonia-lyase [Acidobacteriaceae bacterium]